MEIYATLTHKMEVNPLDVIEKLKESFLGNRDRWISNEHDKWCIMEDAYHNTDSVVKEITDQDKEYFDALELIYKHLHG